MSSQHSRVREIITEFLRKANKPHEDLADDTPLYGDGLELDSLEAAELSALLEDEFGTDPFTAAENPPETIGDVVSFYDEVGSGV